MFQILNKKKGTKIKQHPITEMIINSLFLDISIYIAEIINNMNEIKEMIVDTPRVKSK